MQTMDKEKNEIMLDRQELEVDRIKPSTVVGNGKVDYSGAYEKSDPREIALVKKLDRWILPMLWAMYWLNYLDRNAIALARLDDLEKDLHLKGTEYNTTVSILFVGYLLGQIPSNMILNRVRPSIYMGLWMMLWAIVSALTALAKDYKGLLLTRFFLGVTEAPYYPGAVYLLSIFYTRKEIATRIAILYTGSLIAQAVSGLIAAGIFEGLGDVAGISGWQWLFIIQGSATFVVAIVGCFLLPDFTHNTWWLTQEERDLATARIINDTVGNQGKTSVWAGFHQAGRDPLVWIFAIMAHMHTAATGFKNFFPTVVQTLGFDRTITLVLTCPPYLLAGAVTIIVSWSSGKFNERTWHITISKLVAVLGFGLACASSQISIAGRYIAMVIFTVGTYGVNSLILGWCGSTCGQTPEKRSVAIGIVSTIMNASFIWTPYLWPKTDAPKYITALSSSAAFSICTLLLAWLCKVIFMRKNKKLRATEVETKIFFVY